MGLLQVSSHAQESTNTQILNYFNIMMIYLYLPLLFSRFCGGASDKLPASEVKQSV